MKHLISSLFILLFITSCNAQHEIVSKSSSKEITYTERPKLIVGIVVDQMRYDYLTRFYNKYGEGGFKRMMNEGFNCKNNHYNYVPTYTAPGHASVYTGTSPKYHGIIGNDWYDKELKKSVYCTSDDSIEGVGVLGYPGQMSPHRMKTTTFGDENRLFTQMQGKTIGIALKDRGAILPAGHTANAAYWFEGRKDGKWITSTYYMKELPQWVQDFNAPAHIDSYVKEWNTLYDITSYTESGNDLNTFEGGFRGKETTSFPYDLKSLKNQNGGYDILKATPYGNTLTADFAIEALKQEQLGKGNATDVLTVSFSSTDYVGHNFGVNSKEIEDTYIRLDKDLEHLLNALDANVGKGNYTVFLTADHAAINVPAYLESVHIPAGLFDGTAFREQLTAFANVKFGVEDLIENISNNQIFLNRERIKTLNLKLEDVQQIIADEIISYEHVDKTYTGFSMVSASFSSGIEEFIQNGYNQKRSGDVVYVYDPMVISYGTTGSTHGSSYQYDTHVPLLFFGKGIKQGQTYQKTEITDIAPTISALLDINAPNGAIGQPLQFVFK
ncbi:MAG: alkaline phosphatase PafA [Gelidibacter sp.]